MNRSYSKIRHIQESNRRLERRVINEGEGDPIKIKVWDTTDITKPERYRLDITNVELKNNTLMFNYVIAGMENVPNRTENLLNFSISNKGIGTSPCALSKLVIKNLSGAFIHFYMSEEGNDLLKVKCDEYAKVGNSVGSTDYT
jgi:hypothetical protein